MAKHARSCENSDFQFYVIIIKCVYRSFAYFECFERGYRYSWGTPMINIVSEAHFWPFPSIKSIQKVVFSVFRRSIWRNGIFKNRFLMEKSGISRNISLVGECPSDEYPIRGWFLTISVDEIHQKWHTFGIFGQILLETVCFKIYIFINKSGVLRG